MAAQAFQYIKLPDGTYGKFLPDATDDVIRTQVMKDFPDAFKDQDRTLTPPSVMNKRTPPGSEHMQGQDPFDFGNTPTTPITPMSIAAGTAKDAYTMTRAGYQGAAKGIATGLLHRKSAPLGEPPSQDEFLDAAHNIGTGMVMGGIEGEGMAPAASRLSRATRTADSAPPPTPEAFAPRMPPTRGRSSPAGAGGGGAEFASDMAGLFQPKWMKAVGLMKKWMGKGGGVEAEPEAAATYDTPKAEWGKPGYYGNAAPTTPSVRGAPAYQGKSTGTLVPSVLDSQNPVKGSTRTTYPAEPTPPVTRPPRPEPAWKRLTKGESNSGGAGPETGGDTVIQSPFDAPQYRNASKVLTRGNQGGANYSADDLIAFKKKHGVTDIPSETPAHQPGETATSTAAEIKRLDTAGGQLGQPPATAKLEKAPKTVQDYPPDVQKSIRHAMADSQDPELLAQMERETGIKGGRMSPDQATTIETEALKREARQATAKAMLKKSTPAPTKFPMTGVKAVGEINPHPRHYHPEQEMSDTEVRNATTRQGNSAVRDKMRARRSAADSLRKK